MIFPVLSLAVFGLSTMPSVSTTAESDEIVAQPAGSWQIEEKIDLCEGRREFAAGGKKYMLTLRSQLTGVDYWLGYVDERRAPAFGEADVEISASGNFKRKIAGSISPSTDPRGIAVTAKLPGAVVNAIAKAFSISVAAQGDSMTFGSPDLSPISIALQQCRERRVRSWGVDQAVLDAVAVQRELGKGMGQFFGYNSYPPNAVRRREQGKVVMLLTIGTGGKVSNCRLIESSGSADLDGVSCNIALTRLRYTPAKSKIGQPVVGLQLMSVNWKLAGPPGL